MICDVSMDTWILAIATLVGGILAVSAGFLVVKLQGDAERLLRRDQLKRRLRYVLGRVGSLGQSAAALNIPLYDRPDILEEVVSNVASYERLADFGLYLKEPAFDDAVRTFLIEAAVEARQVLVDGARTIALRQDHSSRSDYQQETNDLAARIQGARNVMGGWKEEARQLLERLNSQ